MLVADNCVKILVPYSQPMTSVQNNLHLKWSFNTRVRPGQAVLICLEGVICKHKQSPLQTQTNALNSMQFIVSVTNQYANDDKAASCKDKLFRSGNVYENVFDGNFQTEFVLRVRKNMPTSLKSSCQPNLNVSFPQWL